MVVGGWSRVVIRWYAFRYIVGGLVGGGFGGWIGGGLRGWGVGSLGESLDLALPQLPGGQNPQVSKHGRLTIVFYKLKHPK